MKKFLLIVIIVAIVGLSVLTYRRYQQDKEMTGAEQSVSAENTETDSNVESDTQKEPEPVDTHVTITPSEGEAITGSGKQMIENVVSIEGQFTYYAYPQVIDTEKPPVLVVYSHGSNTVVTENMKESFMKDLHLWGNKMTAENYAFVASNEHGANWGNVAAVADMENAIKYMRKRFDLQEKVMLVGFSMGGLPTLNFAFENADEINKIALLAGTTYAYRYSAKQYKSLEDIKIKIWHGTADVNVPISLSRDFARFAKKYDLDVTLKEIPNETHWDMDTEKIDEIIDFYND